MSLFLFGDVETTGTDPEKDALLEVAFILTGKKRLDEYGRITLPIFYKRDPEKRLPPRVIEMHTENGLWDDCEKADFLPKVEEAVIKWLNDLLVNDKDKVTLAGNNIEFDRGFLKKYMPTLSERFGYRPYDVSHTQESFYQWAPTVNPKRKQADHINPQAKHRAMDDAEWALSETRKVRELLSKVEETFRPQAPLEAGQPHP